MFKKFVTTAKKHVTRFLTRREEGSTLAEYGLLLALIAVICLASINRLGKQLSTMFNNISVSTSSNAGLAGGRR